MLQIGWGLEGLSTGLSRLQPSLRTIGIWIARSVSMSEQTKTNKTFLIFANSLADDVDVLTPLRLIEALTRNEG